jgi:2-methyl-3-hydroxypyridine 5-carboxylic acid dioxygenase
MFKARHAEIAGAGFAGLVAAIALRHQGWSVRLHEKNAELRAFGAGLFIWENGLRVLQTVDAYDDVSRSAHEALIYEIRHGDQLIAEQAFGPHIGTRMLTMTRQHLYDAIVSAAKRAGVEIVTGSEAVRSDPTGKLITADGRCHGADLVIGADGVRSNVRDSLGLLSERNSYRDGIIRVLAQRRDAQLGDGHWDRVIDFWNIDAGLRILYVPCNKKDLYLAMMAPVANKLASAIPINKEIWSQSFPRLEPIIRTISADGRYDAYETTKLIRWSSGRVAVVGDAAHAMAPTLGQGAGTAMMNALALAVAVGSADSIPEALERWEAEERPLTEYTQDRSAEAARERLMSRRDAWSDPFLRTARHIPTGTINIGHVA